MALLAAAAALAAPSEPVLSLHLRGASHREAVWLLSRLTDRAYVVDPDVLGRADIEIDAAVADEVESLLGSEGLYFTRSGTIRRVATAPVPDLVLPGTGWPVALDLLRGDVRDIIRLFEDITGRKSLAPAGSLGTVSLFASEHPVEDSIVAMATASGLDYRVEGERLVFRRRGRPGEPLFPADVGGIVGHVAYRHGEGAVRARLAGMDGHKADELALWGLASVDGKWMATTRVRGQAVLFAIGQKLFDGTVEAIDANGVVIRLDSGGTVVWHLPAAAPGITSLPDGPNDVLERASAARDAQRYEEAERLLIEAVRVTTGDDLARARAALADLHFAWSRSFSGRGAMEPAVRRLEAALEIDRADRPWQAGEDLNEIGKAWTAIGEPERAVRPHREALEIARSGAVRDAPSPPSCVRAHERTPWVEGDALDGLANAERARGRLAEAASLYGRAVGVWRTVNDPTGLSAALTGLGLVRYQQGRLREAATLHGQALALKVSHPAVRAIVLDNLGMAQLGLKRLDVARAHFEEALAIHRSLQDRAGEGTVLNNLGAYWEARGAIDEACQAYVGALAASRDADDRRGESITRGHIERLRAAGPATAVAACSETP